MILVGRQPDVRGSDSIQAPMRVVDVATKIAQLGLDDAPGHQPVDQRGHQRDRERFFQVMPGAQWLELLCKPIPDRYEQFVRYVGWNSSRSRGARKAKGATAVATTASGVIEVLGEYASHAKARGRGRGLSLPRGAADPQDLRS